MSLKFIHTGPTLLRADAIAFRCELSLSATVELSSALAKYCEGPMLADLRAKLEAELETKLREALNAPVPKPWPHLLANS